MAKKKGRKKNSKPRVERTVWSKDEEGILRKYREDWYDLESRDERDEFCVRVGEEIRDLTPEKYGIIVVTRSKVLKEEWERRFKGIKTWFNNHRSLSKQRRVFKFERKIQLRNVVAHYKHDEIEDETRRLCPGEKPGSQVYFQKYQTALGNIKNSITADELAFYVEKQNEWQSEAPPPEVQRKTAKKYGKRAIHNMHEVAFKQMGMYAITVEAHENQNGQIGLTLHDYNKDLAGLNVSLRSFLQSNRKICNDFCQAYGEWAVKLQEALQGRPSGMEDEKCVIAWKKGPGGIPILPSPVLGKGQYEHLSVSRELLRDFFRIHYRLACKKESAHPPWESMGLHPGKFFSPEHIPDDITLRDPTRMKGHAVRVLIQHLRDRQERNTTRPFRFLNVLIDGNWVVATYPEETGIPSVPYRFEDNHVLNDDFEEEPEGPREELADIHTPPSTTQMNQEGQQGVDIVHSPGRENHQSSSFTMQAYNHALGNTDARSMTAFNHNDQRLHYNQDINYTQGQYSASYPFQHNDVLNFQPNGFQSNMGNGYQANMVNNAYTDNGYSTHVMHAPTPQSLHQLGSHPPNSNRENHFSPHAMQAPSQHGVPSQSAVFPNSYNGHLNEPHTHNGQLNVYPSPAYLGINAMPNDYRRDPWIPQSYRQPNALPSQSSYRPEGISDPAPSPAAGSPATVPPPISASKTRPSAITPVAQITHPLTRSRRGLPVDVPPVDTVPQPSQVTKPASDITRPSTRSKRSNVATTSQPVSKKQKLSK